MSWWPASSSSPTAAPPGSTRTRCWPRSARGRADSGTASPTFRPTHSHPTHSRPTHSHRTHSDRKGPATDGRHQHRAHGALPAGQAPDPRRHGPVSYTHLRAHETRHDLVCRLLLEKKKKKKNLSILI